MEERLQKILSAHGVSSRRAAEGYLSAGRVTVNGCTRGWGTRPTRSRTTSEWTGGLCGGPPAVLI